MSIKGIPFILTQNGDTITICDEGFPSSCGRCKDRFVCYTQAKKFVTLLDYQTYWKK